MKSPKTMTDDEKSADIYKIIGLIAECFAMNDISTERTISPMIYTIMSYIEMVKRRTGVDLYKDITAIMAEIYEEFDD
jgi:hypothetical protein